MFWLSDEAVQYFVDDDNSFADVSESAFMKILNIPIPQ